MWTKREARPTGAAIDNADFLTRSKRGQGTVALTEAEMAGQFSRRQLAEGVQSVTVVLATGCPGAMPADHTEVECTPSVDWTASVVVQLSSTITTGIHAYQLWEMGACSL